MLFCTKCGNQLGIDSKFCNLCGVNTGTQKPPTKSGQYKKIGIILSIAILLVAIGAMAIFRAGSDSLATGFYWRIGSNNQQISIGQTRQQIERILGESPEGSFVSSGLDGMFREYVTYETAGGFVIAYNRRNEVVEFSTNMLNERFETVTSDFLGISIGTTRSDVLRILTLRYGEENIRESHSMASVYFDSDGNATEPSEWAYVIRYSFIDNAVDIMGIYWIEGTFRD